MSVNISVHTLHLIRYVKVGYKVHPAGPHVERDEESRTEEPSCRVLNRGDPVFEEEGVLFGEMKA
jgi:hypothetical protein